MKITSTAVAGTLESSDVYVKVAAAVTAGSGVYIDASGNFTDSTGTAVAGMTYLTSAGADELAVVRVRM